MTPNKMNYKTVCLIFALLFLGTGCNEDSFLDRYPQADPNPENFFVDASTARMAVNSCYHSWAYASSLMLGRDLTIMLDAMTDDSYWRPARTNSITLEMWDINPNHDNVNAWWQFPYQSINAANFAIENIPLSSDPAFTAEDQAPFIAEAKFMRAYSYLFLTMFYGDIPLHLDPASDFTEFNMPVSPRKDIFAQIVEDFKYAKENLPGTQASQGPPSKAAAAAFLAKTYLIEQQWELTESAARDAVRIAEENGFALMDDYMSIWSEEGNRELLFYWSYVENDQNYGQNMTVQRICRELPLELGNNIYGAGWGYCLPQRSLYDVFEEGDPRRAYTVYAPGDDYGIYQGSENFEYTHMIKNSEGVDVPENVVYKPGDMVKYDYRWSPTGLDVRKMTRSVKDLANVRWSGMDIPVMRLAEVYLILAEALAEQGNREALDWINKVRARPSVNMPLRTAADGDLVDLVRHERRVELAMEGLRVFDLIRWGTLSEVFGDGKKVKRHLYSDFYDDGSSLKYDSPVGKLTLDPLFPLPQIEIDNNSEINQNNPGW